MVSKEELLAYARELRSSNPVKSEITEAYRKNLSKCDRIPLFVETSYGDVSCDLYIAKNKTSFSPFFINVHGGGFVRPHLERDSIMAAMIADQIQGVCLDIDYHLAPEYPYPAAVNEVYEITRWAFTKAKEWDVDPARISIGGFSAGATITEAVCLKANETKEFSVCLQALCYGCFEMYVRPEDKPDAKTNLINVSRGQAFNLCYCGGNEELLKEPLCSPGAASDEMLVGMPETLIISAGKDNFRFENARMAERLILAGVKVTAKCFLNSNHGFMTHCSAEYEKAQKLLIDTIRQAGIH